MPYDWKIELSGVDITDKVSRFDITADLAQYCRELVVEIADPDYYESFDFSVIPAAPALEVFTKTADSWVSQGKYFIERPALSSDINRDIIDGLWGRGETARLGAPFAPRISKMWIANTSFFAICAEMCALCGLTWDDSQSAIDDFYIFAYAYQVENAYPVDVLSELAELAGAILTCDRLGSVRIMARDYAPSVATVTIEDADWQAISEAPEWPDFGNRVRIIPTGGLAGYALALAVPDPCLPADGASRARLFAQVTDADNLPVDGETVTWTTDAGSAALDAAATTTRAILMPEEEIRSASRYEIRLAFAPSEVFGVWAFADFRRTTNLAADGYTIDGQQLTLATPLTYCNQLVRVRYTVAGVAENRLTAGSEIEDVTVTAEIAGVRAEAALFVGNDCACPSSLTLSAEPSSIDIGGLSQLLVCGQEGGGPVMGRLVDLYETGAQRMGRLSWARARLHEAVVRKEMTAAANPAAGVTQCEVRHPVKSGATVAVYRADENGLATGGNLYAGNDGRTLILTTFLPTGANLLATYTALGCAVNHFRGDISGTAYLKARMQSNREGGVEADTTVRVTDPADPYDTGSGEYDPGDGGYGGSGGDDSLETDPGNCMKDDGSIIVCSGEGDGWYDAEVCCKSGGVYGCFARSACEDDHADECTPALLAAEPGSGGPGERFTPLKGAGCTCEQICQAEFARLGTTQGYDDGSYRDIDTIVREDDGLEQVEGGDNTAYWAAYDARKAEALMDCVADCELEPLECQPENPETVGAVAVEVAVIGGRAPFQWSVSGTGFTLSASATENRLNTLIPGEGACGAASITITDAAGQSVVCAVRSTAGRWVRIEDEPCVATGSPTEGVEMEGWGTLITGKYKIQEEKYFRYGCSAGGPWFDQCNCGSCQLGSHWEHVCITGPAYECPPTDPYGAGWPLTHQTVYCCYYMTDDGPTNVTWCRRAWDRYQYEWRC